MKHYFDFASDGVWSASFDPPQVVLSEFLTGDLYSLSLCDSLIDFLKKRGGEAWSGEVGSVIIEGDDVVLESLWRGDDEEVKYGIKEFLDVVELWRVFVEEKDLP